MIVSRTQGEDRKAGLSFLLRSMLSMLLVLALVPSVVYIAYADESGAEAAAWQTGTSQEGIETGEDATEGPKAVEEPPVSGDVLPEVFALEEEQLVGDNQPTSVGLSADTSTAGHTPEEGQLRIIGLTDAQTAKLGGMERLTQELELFCEQEQISTVTTATVEEYQEKAPEIIVVLGLDDDACTQVKLSYTDGSYALSRYYADIAPQQVNQEGSSEDTQEIQEGGAQEAITEADPSQEGDDSVETGIIMAPLLSLTQAVSLMPLADITPLALPPNDLVGRFTLSPGFYSTPFYTGGFPGTITVSGYHVLSFGNDNFGSNGLLSCISPGAANWGDPSNGDNRSGTVYAKHDHDNVAQGIAWYRITVVPDNQPASPGSIDGIQFLGDAWLGIAHSFDGVIKLHKSSASPSLTNGNSSYSLNGAQYGVYKTKADASNDANRVTKLTTDASGYAESGALTQATYYVKELVAPSGYTLDDTIYTVELNGAVQTLNVTDVPYGSIELYKKSANTSITNSNKCYSLLGAQYGVYRTLADARNNSNRVTMLTTNASGYAKSGNLTLTIYYVKELVASPGYLLDSTIYTVNLNGAIHTMNVLEAPGGDPVLTLVQKIDTTTGKAYGKDDPEGKSLSGAQFTIRYYDGYYSTVGAAESSGNPKRTWILQTGDNGVATLKTERLVSGSDSLYISPGGNPTIPLGTVLIQETKAPDGYLLPAPNTVSLQQIKLDTTLNSVTRLNTLIVPEAPHELEVIKSDAQTGVVLGGAEFTLYKEKTAGSGNWVEYIKKATDTDGSFKVSPIPVGSYKLVETKAPSGYQLPSESGLPEILFTIEADTQLKTVEAKDYEKVAITPEKIDKDTRKPVPDTEFTLYQYPVELQDGLIITNTSEITANDPGWSMVGTAVTDNDGKIQFSDLGFGYYQLVESRPNPEYTSYAESGGKDRFITLDKYATGETQVFEDTLIQISCEVYKKTIAITSSGQDASSAGATNNVGHEEYLYHFGARSNSNTWADEFIVQDDLSYVTSLGYRMTTLWTGTAPAGMDFDDKMAVLYKTNITADDEPVVFTYNPLSANPYNPNNPDNSMVYSNEPGWRIWAEELPTTQQTRLDVADLNLQEGEYIIGLKIVYGGVTEGFYTGNGWQLEEDPHTVKTTPQGAPTASGRVIDKAGLLEDWWYSVVATESLLPIDKMGDETVMRGSIISSIARNNGVLTDEDRDAVETRVIGYFSFPTTSNGLVGMPQIANFPPSAYPSPSPVGLPRTGEHLLLIGLAAVILAAGIAIIAFSRRLRKRESNSASQKGYKLR